MQADGALDVGQLDKVAVLAAEVFDAAAIPPGALLGTWMRPPLELRHRHVLVDARLLLLPADASPRGEAP